MKRYKDLHCCEVIIKIHVCYTVLHTSEDTVKLLTCFFIQCLHVCVDMWLKCLAAGGMVFTVQRICCKPQIWESGWLSVQTIFFDSAACVIDYCWGIILFKPCHDDIKNNTRAFTLYNCLKPYTFFFGQQQVTMKRPGVSLLCSGKSFEQSSSQESVSFLLPFWSAWYLARFLLILQRGKHSYFTSSSFFILL